MEGEVVVSRLLLPPGHEGRHVGAWFGGKDDVGVAERDPKPLVFVGDDNDLYLMCSFKE